MAGSFIIDAGLDNLDRSHFCSYMLKLLEKTKWAVSALFNILAVLRELEVSENHVNKVVVNVTQLSFPFTYFLLCVSTVPSQAYR